MVLWAVADQLPGVLQIAKAPAVVGQGVEYLVTERRRRLYAAAHQAGQVAAAAPHRVVPGIDRAIHLQCAGGRDTLSLWNLGATEVVGVDFSPRMLALAARLTDAVAAPARWIEADVLDTPHELDSTADLLYTGRGSLIWLQDLDAWAAVLQRLLAPDGRLVLFEGHPAEWLFDVGADGRWVATDYDYFGGPEASRGWAPEYIDHLSIEEGEQHWKFARSWTLGEILTAMLGAGLRLERVVEYPIDWWGGHADAAPHERGRIPLSFGVVARRGP